MILRMATPADVPEILAIMNAAYEALADKSLYITDDEDYIATHVKDQGFTLIAQEEDIPVGFFLVCVPGLAENNLGRYLDLPEAQLKQVTMMDSAAVLPACQGRGVMGAMFRRAVELAGERYPILLGTVSPDNAPSLRNFEKCGFSPLKQVVKPGGYTRLLMGKVRGNLNGGIHPPQSASEES